MKIACITAGAAGRYCGSCLRDNVLVIALRELGEDAILIPTYTPIRTDIADASERRLFFNGTRVYLEQKIEYFRRPHPVLDRLLGSTTLLRFLSRLGSPTDPRRLGELTVSMLRGEEGHQKKELEELVRWLQRYFEPDVVHLSHLLLVGMARRLREVLEVPVVCGVQAEDSFLDLLPERERRASIELIRERGSEVDRLISPSRYYAECAARNFGVPRERVSVVRPGIPLDGHEPIDYRRGDGLAVGYLSRIAPEKGLHLMCEAFRRLAKDPELPGLRLRVAGFLASDQAAYASRLRKDMARAGLRDRVEFIGTVDRAGKLRFLRSIDVFSAPGIYPDPAGLCVMEALASGVPAVSPRHGALPELLEITGGGELFEPGDAASLAEALRRLLVDVEMRSRLGAEGRRAVLERFSAGRMARETLEVYRGVISERARFGGRPPSA